MTGDDPPFLTVGTAVSAKYRGAFCEAKVKVMKKLVKCKIKFKSGPSSIVNDEFVKGPLKVGVVVEAKQSESGPYEDGTIMKLTDASLYTVVFDDGDEKTLRRTLLCLQGEKHFHESETLDHLPLTDPENFGTPVVKHKKGMGRNRRYSNRSQSDDDEEEDEEEEEEEESDVDTSPRKQRKEEPDDAVGKVVVVEMNEKRKNFLFPALVVDPSCTKDVVMRGKDQIIVRSFKDNKFYTVAKSSRKPFITKDHTYKGDVASLKAATEKAVTYIDTGQLPSNWDLDMLKKKTKQGHADPVDDTSEDSSDDEYDMEKDAWLASLHKFMEERGTPINKPPVLGYRDLNLYKLYKLVQDHGGCRKVTDRQLWRNVMTKMGIPVPTLPQPYNIHTAYNKYLVAFEDFNRKMGPGPRVFTRTRRRSFDRGWMTPPMIPRQRSSVKQEVRDEPSDREEEEESPKKRVTRKKVEEANKLEIEESSRETKRETREAKAKVKELEEDEEPSDKEERRSSKKTAKEEKTRDRSSAKEERTRERANKEEEAAKEKSGKEERSKDRSREEKARERVGEEKSGEKSNEERGKDRREGRSKEGPGEESGSEKSTPGKSREKSKDGKVKEKKSKTRGIESPKEEPSKAAASKAAELNADFDVGEKVLVHYGRGRTEKIYEAKVVDIEMKGKDHIFTVHYTGWNNRYDEAVKRNRIVGSAEKKKKQKVTPKGKSEKEKGKREEKKEKDDVERREKDEADRKQEELELKMRQAKELEERQEKERLEKERAEKERQENDCKEKQEKERKERERKEKLEKEKLEKERKDRQEKERREQQERERREKMERERKEKQEKEQREKLEKEKQEREKKERQDREKREKLERERREKEERDRREKDRLELEKHEKEAAEKMKEAEKERKEKEKSAKEGKRTPSGKRGRPSMNKSPVAPSSPRATTPSRGKSPSPASVFSQRSMRSDRKSLTESPFASGLFVRGRSKRSSTGEYKRGSQDSDSEGDEADDRSESQQSAQDSEDSSSQAKGGRAHEQEETVVSGTSKTEDSVATLIKVGEDKLIFNEDSDDGPPTLTAQVGFETPETRVQDADVEAPKVEPEKAPEEQEVGRSRSKKDSKRIRKSLERERDASRELAPAAHAPSEEKTSGKESLKDSSEKDEVKVKVDETPVLEKQVHSEAELKDKIDEIKQEDKDSTSDADKAPEKRKGRKKGRKSVDSRKRTKNELETDNAAKTDNLETFEPKKKHAKVDRRKSDKGRKKQNEPESRLLAEAIESDVVSSSVEEKSLPGTSKSFMTTPPTTPESSPKMPSSPSQAEDLNLKAEEQSSNKSDSDALIEVASIEDKDPAQTPSIDVSAMNTSSGAVHMKATPVTTAPCETTPKKRRRGASESEPGKKRRKRSRRRKSNLAERRHSSQQDCGQNNSSDTDESRSESRLTSSAGKEQFSLKNFAGNLSSAMTASGGQQGSQKQRRWNFLVDLSNIKEPDERIAIIQRQLTDLRSVYLRLKQEVATIDRRRKKFRKKEREAAQVMAGVALGLPQGLEKQDLGGS